MRILLGFLVAVPMLVHPAHASAACADDAADTDDDQDDDDYDEPDPADNIRVDVLDLHATQDPDAVDDDDSNWDGDGC